MHFAGCKNFLRCCGRRAYHIRAYARSDAMLSQFVCFENRLVRILAKPEKLHSHPGQHLKLGVRRAGSDNRHLQITGRIVIIQIVKIRNDLIAQLQEINQFRVNKRFQQNTDDVRILSVRYVSASSGISTSFRRLTALIVIRGLLSVTALLLYQTGIRYRKPPSVMSSTVAVASRLRCLHSRRYFRLRVSTAAVTSVFPVFLFCRSLPEPHPPSLRNNHPVCCMPRSSTLEEKLYTNP